MARCRVRNFEVVRGPWKDMVVPSIMYRLETTVRFSNDPDRLDVVQNKAGKVHLGANCYVASQAV